MGVVITIPIVHDTAISVYTIAAFITICRLVIRIHDKKWGWDDFCAAVALVTGGLMLTGALILIGPTPSMTDLTMVAGYYITACGFYACIWACRFSILCTISRITPAWWRPYIRAMFFAFGGMYLFLTIQAIVHCESDPSWKPGQCSLGRQVAAAQLVTDIVSDLMLSLAPVRLLWQSNLSRAQRIRLITVFASCILTSLVSLAHAYCIWVNKGLDEVYSAMYELSVSIIVCSLSVLVGFFSRLRKSSKGLMDSTSNDRSGTRGGATSGFELAVHSRPINVDITTTTWVDNEHGGHKQVDAEEGLDAVDYKTKDHLNG